jgi:hypothetical protein
MLLQRQRQKGSELAQPWYFTRAHGATTGRRWRRGFGAIKISDAVWKSARSLERVVVKKNRAFAFLGTFNAADHQLSLIVRFVQSSAQRPWNLSLQNSTTIIRRSARRLVLRL